MVIDMTDYEIKEELKRFQKRIFNMKASEAYDVKRQLDSFILDNNVTVEQMREFEESGAGEELYMLTC